MTQFEAIDENASFAHTHDGSVVSITSSKLMMTNKDANSPHAATRIEVIQKNLNFASL